MRVRMMRCGAFTGSLYRKVGADFNLLLSPGDEAGEWWQVMDSHWLPMAMSLVFVRKNSVPSEIAGVARQMSPRLFTDTVENWSVTGTTTTLPASPAK